MTICVIVSIAFSGQIRRDVTWYLEQLYITVILLKVLMWHFNLCVQYTLNQRRCIWGIFLPQNNDTRLSCVLSSQCRRVPSSSQSIMNAVQISRKVV